MAETLLETVAMRPNTLFLQGGKLHRCLENDTLRRILHTCLVSDPSSVHAFRYAPGQQTWARYVPHTRKEATLRCLP